MFKKGEVVWARSAIGRQMFWPAKVIDEDNELTRRKRKRVVGCVQFLMENSCEAITDSRRLLAFNIKQKNRFLKKGQGLKDVFKRLQFDSAVKQAEQQISTESSEEPSNATYCKAAETTINHSEANAVGKTSAFDAPKLNINSPKNRSQKFCKGKQVVQRDAGLVTRPVSPLTRRAKRTRLFYSTEEGNYVESIFKQRKEKNKDSRKNASSPNRCKKRSKKVFVTKDDITPAEQHESVGQFDCYEKRPDVSPAQNNYGANYVSWDISTRSLNDDDSKAVDQDDDEEMFISNDLHQNGVDRDDEADMTKNNHISEDELPEAFSPSPECIDFHSGDVVWAKYKRQYWPAQIGRVTVTKKHRLYYIRFLPKQDSRCMKINKNNIIPFTDTYEHHKNQKINDTEQDEFKEALKVAEDILVRKASKKDDVLFPEDCSNDCLFTISKFQEPCESNDTEERIKTETGERGTLTTPERRRSQRKGISVSKYNEIIIEFHRCKSRLVKIFHGKVPCERHRKFYGTVAEKDSLKYLSGFGPIQNDEICEKILQILNTWYEEVQKPLIQPNYVYDVWLPEAIIFFIMNNESADLEVAEMIYLDHARNVPKKEAEDVKLWLKNHKIDENAMEESVEKAKRAFEH